MKNILLLLIIFLLSCNSVEFGIADGENSLNGKSVLFVGNSYTFYNEMPLLVQKMAFSANDQLNYKMHAPGGAIIFQHANSDALERTINSKKWDYVTIQTQSLESALSEEHFSLNVFPHVQTLLEKIKNNSNDTDALFYMTWGYENGEYPPCAGLPYLCEFEGMNDKLTERYTYMAQITNSVVSPVGVVWKNIRASNPEINLYNPDESHPSLIGSYLAACTFYTIIFEKDPTLMTYNNEQIDDDIEGIIKKEVRNTVFNNLNSWYYN